MKKICPRNVIHAKKEDERLHFLHKIALSSKTEVVASLSKAIRRITKVELRFNVKRQNSLEYVMNKIEFPIRGGRVQTAWLVAKKNETSSNESLIINNLSNIISLARKLENCTHNMNTLDGFVNTSQCIWYGEFQIVILYVKHAILHYV